MSLPSTTWTLISDAAVLSTGGTGAGFAGGIDLELDGDGDLIVVGDARLTVGPNAVAQGIRRRLQTFRGEWFLDLDFGVPYFQDLLGPKFNAAKARAAFREAIEGSPGVDELLELKVRFESSTRRLYVDWIVLTTFGVLADSNELEA